MNKISGIDFYNQWCNTLYLRKEEFIPLGFNSKAITGLIFKSENSIISELANKFNLNCHCEYYFLDAIFYANEDVIKEKKNNGLFLREIRIAFEHENYFNSGLYKELSHLLITNADLKVLVSYPGGYDLIEELEYLHTLIKGNTKSEIISEEESFLIILGHEANCTWQGYIYKEDNWKKIET